MTACREAEDSDFIGGITEGGSQPACHTDCALGVGEGHGMAIGRYTVGDNEGCKAQLVVTAGDGLTLVIRAHGIASAGEDNDAAFGIFGGVVGHFGSRLVVIGIKMGNIFVPERIGYGHDVPPIENYPMFMGISAFIIVQFGRKCKGIL